MGGIGEGEDGGGFFLWVVFNGLGWWKGDDGNLWEMRERVM